MLCPCLCMRIRRPAESVLCGSRQCSGDFLCRDFSLHAGGRGLQQSVAVRRSGAGDASWRLLGSSQHLLQAIIRALRSRSLAAG